MYKNIHVRFFSKSNFKPGSKLGVNTKECAGGSHKSISPERGSVHCLFSHLAAQRLELFQALEIVHLVLGDVGRHHPQVDQRRLRQAMIHGIVIFAALLTEIVETGTTIDTATIGAQTAATAHSGGGCCQQLQLLLINQIVVQHAVVIVVVDQDLWLLLLILTLITNHHNGGHRLLWLLLSTGH